MYSLFTQVAAILALARVLHRSPCTDEFRITYGTVHGANAPKGSLA